MKESYWGSTGPRASAHCHAEVLITRPSSARLPSTPLPNQHSSFVLLASQPQGTKPLPLLPCSFSFFSSQCAHMCTRHTQTPCTRAHPRRSCVHEEHAHTDLGQEVTVHQALRRHRTIEPHPHLERELRGGQSHTRHPHIIVL